MSDERERLIEILALDLCVRTATETPDLMVEFDRLYGTNIMGRRSPIERMVDEASGAREDDLRRFIEFVRENVWERGPEEMRVDIRRRIAAALDAEGARP